LASTRQTYIDSSFQRVVSPSPSTVVDQDGKDASDAFLPFFLAVICIILPMLIIQGHQFNQIRKLRKKLGETPRLLVPVTGPELDIELEEVGPEGMGEDHDVEDDGDDDEPLAPASSSSSH
jgi:hypothetical protein